MEVEVAGAPAALFWAMYGALGTIYRLPWKTKEDNDTALYIPNMKPSRSIGHGEDCWSIDGMEESRVRCEAVSYPSKM